MAFGEILKQKRQERNWTKEYIVERTHLMTRTVEALEAEDLRRIPATVYGRGFIRKYCDLLGIDAQPLVDDYMRLATGGHETYVSREQEAQGETSVSPERLKVRPIVSEVANPEAGESKNVQEEPFALEGDVVPPSMGATTSRQEAKPDPLKARLAEPDFRAKRLRQEATLQGKRSLFSPQQPVPDPPNPQWRFLCTLAQSLAGACVNLWKHSTLPRVRHIGDGEEGVDWRRVFFRSGVIALIVAAVLLFAFAFRYVFRASATAEREVGVTSQDVTPFSVKPLPAPTAPYLK